jgi:hypothetical protein
MIATEKSKVSPVAIDLSQPRKAPPLVPKILQRPLALGAVVGAVIGVLNSIVLSIPLLLSAPTGIVLGVLVCVVASPNMRNELSERKQLETEYKNSLLERKGRSGAFTQFD